MLGAESEDSRQSAVGSWQLAVGSWQLAVGSWQSAVGSWQSAAGFAEVLSAGRRLRCVGWGQLGVGFRWGVSGFV